jgi:hypothetical protein
MRAPLPTILALAALALPPGHAWAQAPAAPAPPVGEVRVGAEIVTLVPRLPAGTTEFELVLLPESGPAIQVSPEMRAGAIDVHWVMPRVYGRTARLALRYGGPGHESRSEPSAAFVLAAPGADEVADLIALRSGAARWPECESGPVPGFAPAADHPDLAALPARIRAIAPEVPAILPPPASPAAGPGFQDASRETTPSGTPRSRAPAFRPLRN